MVGTAEESGGWRATCFGSGASIQHASDLMRTLVGVA